MLAITAGRQSPPKTECPSSPRCSGSSRQQGLVSLASRPRRLQCWLSLRVLARSNVFTRPRVGGLFSVGSSVLACNWCSQVLPSIPSRRAAARARARLQAAASSALVAVAPRVGASAVAAQVIACSAAALAPTKGCCLTLRSWGLPPARHLARAPASVIIRRAGQAPSRRQPLSSNVRPHQPQRWNTTSGCLAVIAASKTVRCPALGMRSFIWHSCVSHTSR